MNLFALTFDEAGKIAAEVELPLFVYKLSIAENRWKFLRSAMPDRVQLAYAVKANPGLPLLKRLAELGASFDCASAGELQRLLGLSVSGERLLMAGPAKSREDISLALSCGAKLQLDSREDFAMLYELLKKTSKKSVDVNLRVHPEHVASEKNSIIGGAGPSAFGVDEEMLEDFLNSVSEYPSVCIHGLQVFTASNELTHTALLKRYKVAFSIARKMHSCGIEVETIDLGGGLGIPYSEEEARLDVLSLGKGLGELLKEEAWFTGTLILEPGRWLAGPCGVYLTKVIRTKHSRGINFVLLQEGINHLLRPLLTGQAFPVSLVTRQSKVKPSRTQKVLAGPLCTSLDRLGSVLLPDVKPGDLLMLGQTGAYGLSEAMNDFLCRPKPQELWLEADL